MKELLKGGTVVTGTECIRADVLMEDGKIAAVGTGIDEEGAKVTSVAGKYLFPGFIDAHTHFDLEVSGTVTADGFQSGTRAAIAGGTTTIIDFATQNKGETLEEALANWHRKADGKSSCDYGFHMAISDWNEHTKEELKDMIDAGVTTFKLYMTYDNMVVDDGQLFEVLEAVKSLGGLVGVHCENMLLIKELAGKLKQAGRFDTAAHPLSRPACVEAEAVQRLLTIARLADTPVMVVHLSSQEGYEQVMDARRRGQKVYAETCPQYLLLDDSVYSAGGIEGAKYICSPPLRKKEDQSCLWQALKNGDIQTLSTDHCSFTTKQKSVGLEDFGMIPNGMPGVEERPALIYTEAVRDNRLTLPQLCLLMAENPAKLYGLYPKKGAILEGGDADIVVWDPECEFTITSREQGSSCDYAPFEGKKCRGRAAAVYLHGCLAAEYGKVVAPGRGSYVERKLPEQI